MSILSDIRVLDFSRYVAGPYCASILAALGAEVIRIEPPEGGEDRKLIPLGEKADGALFLQLNRGKKSLAINSASPRGREAIERLVPTADVVITNMPVKALKKRGLDYETLQKLRGDIITTNLSAFGTKGPLRDKTGFDAVAQGVSGSAYLGGEPLYPSRAASSYVDYGTGLAAAMGTLAAVIHRMKTGEGQDVQASLLATALTFINAAHIEAAVAGRDRQPWGNRSPFSAPSDFFRTADGCIAVQVVGNLMFGRWASLIGRPELADDPRFASDSDRGHHGAELSRIMQEWTAAKTTKQALQMLEAAGVPGGPVYSPRQVAADPCIAGSAMLSPTRYEGIDVPLPLASFLVQMDCLDPGGATPVPRIGQHTEELLRSVGYSPQEVRDLLEIENVRNAIEGARP